jgi:cell division protein FtsZ
MVAIRMDDTHITAGKGARIVVVGVGGGGGNAVDNMVEAGLSGVNFLAANTDVQALDRSKADHKIPLGERLTKGLGAGADPQKGRESAMEDQALLAELVKETDMVFVTAGMGGGTGTGAAPVIAKAAQDAGALTVGVVTRPFTFEGMPRMRNAEQGIKELSRCVDSLIVIPNDRLLESTNEPMALLDSFKMADSVLRNAVSSISDLIVVPGLINVDFADAKRIMRSKGKAVMGIGDGTGEGRATQAAQTAMTSPILEEAGIEGATGVLVNITGGQDLKIQEINEAMDLIAKTADPSAEIIMGCVIDEDLSDRIKITIIATGFDMEREYDREFELQGSSQMPVDSAQPRHWNERPRGILANNQQQRAQQPQQQRRYVDESEPRGQYNASPPPLPQARPVTVEQQRQVTQPTDQRSTQPSDDFDPTAPSKWF